MKALVAVSLASFLMAEAANAKSMRRSSNDFRTLRLTDKQMGVIEIDPNGTILSFPTKPSKIVLGREKQFDVQYVESDIAVVALHPGAAANMYVYLWGKRYNLALHAATLHGDRIVLIRDPREKEFKVVPQ